MWHRILSFELHAAWNGSVAFLDSLIATNRVDWCGFKAVDIALGIRSEPDWEDLHRLPGRLPSLGIIG